MKESKMKFYAEKYDEWCGVALVKHPETDEEIYVVYANLCDDFDSKIEDRIREDGQVIGSGKTKEEAMADAIKNMVYERKEYDQKIEQVKEKLSDFQFSPYGMRQRIIVPLSWGDSYNEENLKYNADVFINWKKKKVELGQG